ncbi:MAG: NAD(P)-dependent oxidoreductase [Magnetococcales bacterium]|nr:NAD(P)-dependent oxidoreductase [Magnetococcales bacterium]
MGGEVWISGASGFFGAHLVRGFARSGWRVTALCRGASDTRRLDRLLAGGPEVNRLLLDLQDQEAVETALDREPPEVLVHAAAYGVDHRQQEVATALSFNAVATAFLVDAAARNRVGRFLHIGTAAEYGDAAGLDGPVDEESLPRPAHHYGISKLAGTLLALGRARAAGLPLAVVRPFGMYGPLEGEHKFVPQVLRACLSRTPLPLTEGTQIRDYCYVEDVVDASLRLAAADPFPDQEIINLGSARPLTLRALGESAAAVVGNGTDMLQWGRLPMRQNEVPRIVCNADKARRLLNWQATTSLESGLEATLHFEKERPGWQGAVS